MVSSLLSNNYTTTGGNWVLTNEAPVVVYPDYEAPLRVRREGINNYVKNRGSLNIGDWETEGRQPNASARLPPPAPPKVFGIDATLNYTKSRGSTANLLTGYLDPPNPHQGLRVKKEGRANYEKNHDASLKTLLQNYGKLPISDRRVPNTKGEFATRMFYSNNQGSMGQIINDYGRALPSPRPVPNVKGAAATENRIKGQGDSFLITNNDPNAPTMPRCESGLGLKGDQAVENYDRSQGRNVDLLFHQYGRLPQSARANPKVKYQGVDNYIKDRGSSMRKTLSQVPPSTRFRERPQSVPPQL
ncbi:unnamed protein product [Didymodactylos carnosus]|uniref:Uncharacterized protein n=1 Tax=Didymodactylos carnosus TaxID=1234261 RepID=A0A814CCV1_9BILA|nr:unnamed protein product [Didymodactylos carnosus]CAF1051883.1 unnamed protein product [Didymodactylos carnosus]CAF3715216.1 unnamed protein product [Didymodactylos carnosus]CAF3818524.1 unnamed protein product [Didymodactylos carnosus]